jgi:hypothetical protein
MADCQPVQNPFGAAVGHGAPASEAMIIDDSNYARATHQIA